MKHRFGFSEKLVYLAAFVCALMVPWVALAVGNRTELDPRVEPAQRPSVRPENWLDPSVWNATDLWLTDNMALHDEAVRATSSVNYRLFEDSNNVEAVVGTHGWVFSRPELDAYCPTDVGYLESVSIAFEPSEMVELMGVVTDIVELSGRDLWWTLPPSRWYAYPDRLNSRAKRLSNCASEFRKTLRQLLDQAAMPRVVPLWDGIDDARDAAEAAGPGPSPMGGVAPPLVYYPHDLHWNTRGAAVMTERIVNAISPGLWDTAALVPVGDEDKEATQLLNLGLDGIDPDVRYGVIRPGVRAMVTGEYSDNEFLSPTLLPDDQWYLHEGPVPGSIVCDCQGLGRLDDHPLLRFAAESDDPSLIIPGHTLWLHDSFSWWATGQLPSYFESLAMLRGKTVEAPTVFHDEFNAADRIVIAFSEMLFTRRLDPAFPLVRRLVEESAATLTETAPERVHQGVACSGCNAEETWTSPAEASTWQLPAGALTSPTGVALEPPYLVTVEVAPTTFSIDPQGIVIDAAYGVGRAFNPLGYEPAVIRNGVVEKPHRYHFYVATRPADGLDFTVAKDGTRIERYSVISLAAGAGADAAGAAGAGAAGADVGVETGATPR